jgi:hypothetical protein
MFCFFDKVRLSAQCSQSLIILQILLNQLDPDRFPAQICTQRFCNYSNSFEDLSYFNAIFRFENKKCNFQRVHIANTQLIFTIINRFIRRKQYWIIICCVHQLLMKHLEVNFARKICPILPMCSMVRAIY